MCRNCVKNDDFVENGYFQEKFYLETLGLLEKDLKVDFVVVVIVRKLCGKWQLCMKLIFCGKFQVGKVRGF